MIFITILRHGRTTADDENKYEGRYDCELTDIGKKQVIELKNKWQNDKKRLYETIVTSPLKRTKATAQIMSSLYNVPIIDNEYLLELDAGLLKGMNKAEADKQYPMPSFYNQYDRIVKGTGESEAQLHSRAMLAMEAIINMKKKSYLIVSHGMIINAILRSILSLPLPINGSGSRFRFGDTAFMDLLYEENKHVWTVLQFHNEY